MTLENSADSILLEKSNNCHILNILNICKFSILEKFKGKDTVLKLASN